MHPTGFASNPTLYDYYMYRKSGELDVTDIRAVLDLENPDFARTNLTLFVNLSALARSAYTSDLEEIGPEPSWANIFDPSYFMSSVMFGTFTGIDQLLSQNSTANTAVNLVFRSPVPVADIKYWSLTPGEALVYIRDNACVAFAVPWYWDPNDNLTTSGLANVSFIRDYRLSFDVPSPFNASNPMAQPPRFRWKCQRDKANAWPRIITSFPFLDANQTRPDSDKWLGIRLNNDVNNLIAALIRSPQNIPPDVVPTPTDCIIPGDPDCDPVPSYIVMGIAILLLSILIVIVIIKSITQKN